MRRSLARARRAGGAPGSGRSRRTSRRCGGDHSWVLWIDVWGEALRDANLRRISEELDDAWVELLAEVIADGVATGVFHCDDPVAAAVAAVRPARRPRPAGRAAPGDDDAGPDAQPRPPRRRARARLRRCRRSNHRRRRRGSIGPAVQIQTVARRRPLVHPSRVGNGGRPANRGARPTTSSWCSLHSEPPRTRSERRCAPRWTTPVPRRSPSSTRSRRS